MDTEDIKPKDDIEPAHKCHENCESYGDGMCVEGCCDMCVCKICGRIYTTEVAQ